MVVQDNADTRDATAGVRLEPFLHQVGGHLSVMQYDEHTVCKPLISQEQRFYESLPLAMRCFTPQYKGTITVHLRRDSKGHLSLVAHPLKESQGPFQVSSESTEVAIWRTLRQTANSGGSPHPLAQLAHSFKESTAKGLLRSDFHLSTQVSLVEDTDGNQTARRNFNPWGLHCHQAHLTRLCSEYPEDKRHRILTHSHGHTQFPGRVGAEGAREAEEAEREQSVMGAWVEGETDRQTHIHKEIHGEREIDIGLYIRV